MKLERNSSLNTLKLLLEKTICGLHSTQIFPTAWIRKCKSKTQKREGNFVYEYDEDFFGEFSETFYQ